MHRTKEGLIYPHLNSFANRTRPLTNADFLLFQNILEAQANAHSNYRHVFAHWGSSREKCLVIDATVLSAWGPGTPFDSLVSISQLIFADDVGSVGEEPSSLSPDEARRIAKRLL